MFQGDCNERVTEIAAAIPDKALTLAFIDPDGLDVDFKTIGTLSSRGRVDLLVLFADRMDVSRNLGVYMEEGSRLDRFLGPDSQWRERLRDSVDSPRFLDALRSIYEGQLRRNLGYRVFGHRTMEGPRGPLYKIVYASKHERGLEFWNKATAKDRRGQKELF
jgi:three-Cys-motif partner protein